METKEKIELTRAKLDENERRFFDKCLKFLDDFRVDYTGDVVYLTDGGNGCIMNPNYKMYDTFGGHSINEVARYVGEKMGAKIEWEREMW